MGFVLSRSSVSDQIRFKMKYDVLGCVMRETYLTSLDVWMVSVHGVSERDKGIRWMPWYQEAKKDVARCEKLRGAASRL